MKRDLNKFSLRIFKFVQRSQSSQCRTIFFRTLHQATYFFVLSTVDSGHIISTSLTTLFFASTSILTKIAPAKSFRPQQFGNTRLRTHHDLQYTIHTQTIAIIHEYSLKLLLSSFLFSPLLSIYYRLISCTSLDCRHLRAADHAAYIIWRHFLV